MFTTYILFQRAKVSTEEFPQSRKSKFTWKNMIHNIGLIVPASKLNGIKGIRIPECNGWVISNATFFPEYLERTKVSDKADKESGSDLAHMRGKSFKVVSIYDHIALKSHETFQTKTQSCWLKKRKSN